MQVLKRKVNDDKEHNLVRGNCEWLRDGGADLRSNPRGEIMLKERGCL